MEPSRQTDASFDFSSVADRARELRVVLADLGVCHTPGSWLGRVLDAGELAMRMEPSADMNAEARRLQAYRDVGELLLLANTVLGVSPELRQRAGFLAVLRLLGQGDASSFAGASHSTARNRVLELHCAAWVDSFAADVDFAEPDVVCNYQRLAWGVACKSVRGSLSRSARRIRDGVTQCDGAGIQQGLVLVRVTDLLDHERWWGSTGPSGTQIRAFRSGRDAQQHIRASFAERADRIHDELARSLRPRQAWPLRSGIGVMYLGATVTMVGVADDATPVVIPCGRTHLAGDSGAELRSFVQALWTGFGRALGAL